eukprot:4494220-Amphidinium_carterae.2
MAIPFPRPSATDKYWVIRCAEACRSYSLLLNLAELTHSQSRLAMWLHLDQSCLPSGSIPMLNDV